MRLVAPMIVQAKAYAKRMESANVTQVLVKQIVVKQCAQMIAPEMVSAWMENVSVGQGLAVQIAPAQNAAPLLQACHAQGMVLVCYPRWSLKLGVNASQVGMEQTVSMVMSNVQGIAIVMVCAPMGSANAMKCGRALIAQLSAAPTNVRDMEVVICKRELVLAKLVGKGMIVATNCALMSAVARDVVLPADVNVHLDTVAQTVPSPFASKSACNMASVSKALANVMTDGPAFIVKKKHAQKIATTVVYAMMGNVSV